MTRISAWKLAEAYSASESFVGNYLKIVKILTKCLKRLMLGSGLASLPQSPNFTSN